jgi:hypothetical protein
MANKRIKDLATTASSAASDDFMALDGATNGTRKMSAANPSVTTLTTSGVITPGGSVHGADGSFTNPSFAFNSDQNTGLYRIGPDNIGVAANGAKVLDIATTGLTVTGALGASSLTSPAGNNLTLAAGGTNQSVVLTPSGTGGVGIGTVTPLVKLDIVPAVTKTDTTSFGYGVFNLRTNETTNYSEIRVSFIGGAAQASRGFQFQTGEAFVSNVGNILFQPYGGNVLIGTTDSTGLTGSGGLKIASSTAGAANAGALVVTGGLSAGNNGNASYFGGAVSYAGALKEGSDNVISSSGTALLFGNSATWTETRLGSTSASGIVTLYAGNAERMRIASTGAATFAGAVTVSGNGGFPTLFIGADGLGGGGANRLIFNYEGNAGSRSWRIVNDQTAFGDFAIQQSTTRTGSTYANAVLFDTSLNATFAGAVTVTGNIGFYGQAATAKPTSVAVTAAAIHAALVTLNLIAA